ncbi:MAG: RnfABCDGE type electron transport complex subunit G [Lentisphaerae bacterium]|jgi:electron transport complex protein RnfG|nr:RnfABCDGE type electron transport complex subunit G [Lentisphaerota bacterium]
MKEYLRLIFVLTITCLVCTALLATVYHLTLEPIAEARLRQEQKAISEVLPPGYASVKPIAVGGITNYVALDEAGQMVAAAVKGHSEKGYGGAISLIAGFAADGRLYNFKVLQASETPGLGSRIDSDEFKTGIRGRPADTRWATTKDGGEIDAVTAATISSRAALEAISAASAQFQAIREAVQKGVQATL